MANKAAKKITEILTYQLVNGSYQPETRSLYRYNANGSLNEIQLYRKKADQSNYLAGVEKYAYEGNKLERVTRYNEANALVETTSFSYSADGKITRMINSTGNQRTEASVQYTTLGGSTGISGNYLISIHYQYSFVPYSMTYNLSMQGGVIKQSTKSTSHGNNETAHLQYDCSINPLAHLPVRDIYFSNYSKHNRVAQQTMYTGAYPSSEPYSYNYTYNSEGYPLKLITKYRTYLSGQHAFTIKTVFKY